MSKALSVDLREREERPFVISGSGDDAGSGDPCRRTLDREGPADVLVTSPGEEMRAWRVASDAKNSRIVPHPGMAEPVEG